MTPTVDAEPSRPGSRPAIGLGLALLGASALALALAPLALTGSYSWLEHTTSESAAQRVDGAWIARSGFVLFGLAVLWIAHRANARWGRTATAFHVVFGACMVGVAAFSLRSWEPTVGYDRTEDLLHSVAATTMGFAFAFGVAGVGLGSRAGGWRLRPLDGIAIVASVVLPIGMGIDGSIDGALQRAMFAIAYVWYGREAVLAG